MPSAHFSATRLPSAALAEPRSARRASPAVIAGYLLAYVALDWISFVSPIGPFGITPWNPPPGLSVAFLLRYGVRQGPWLFVAALAAEFVVRGAPAPLPILVAASALLALGYTGFTALLVRVLEFRPSFPSLRDTALFIGSTGVASAVIAIAFVSLVAGSGLVPAQDFRIGVTQFWIGDWIGVVVTTPAVLLAARLQQLRVRFTLELALQALSMMVAIVIVFGTPLGAGSNLFYALFLPVIWIAMRHGIEGGAYGALIVQLGLIAAIVATHYADEAVLDIQVLMLAVAATGLLLGAAVSERREIERQLRDKQARLDRSLRLAAASELASALAHELNQPLAAITVYLRACQMMITRVHDAPDELRTTMSKVVGEAVRAGDVVRRLRDFFRSGVAQPERVAPSVLIAEASATLRERAERNKITLEVHTPALPDVIVDRVQIEAVLHNLLANAIDALKSGATERKIRVLAGTYADGFVLISVEDNGPGVAPEVVHELFEPFVTTKPRGTGLGLAISRSIVEAHGGRLWHEERQPGSAFCFTVREAPNN
jgi:signal transduction histidine kinase